MSLSMRSFAEFENMMTSSQRIMEYTELDQEDDINKAIDKELENWPENGQIEFN